MIGWPGSASRRAGLGEGGRAKDMADVQEALGIDSRKLNTLPEVSNSAAPNVFEQAVSQWPVLKSIGAVSKFSPGQGDQNMLEFWPPGEGGSPDSPRPSDVLGDVVSHFLVKQDPVIAATYEQFTKSLGPEQQTILQEQYKYAIANEGEKRPFQEWLQSTGLPAYFRGYAFQQWPAEFNEKAYTPEQRQMFDQMMQYLQTGK